ncbi:alpha/beta fold hydrolase [Nonomuraea sp. NEAU-L178]|nr:alpha/beta fold hydrolase [Nonomuraea aurantiaca]MCA2222040.1 alpha/beta fold hydrolase [Nonomuraea aurantiaca]
MDQAISKDGTAIAYDRFGDGPALILVGGAMSYRSFPTFIQLAELLADRFSVITYDRRGRGDSGDTAPYAVEREVEDLAAVIEAAGGSAHVWGLSSGAALALRAAADGLPIERLALYEPPFMVGEGGHRPPADYQERLTALAAAGRRGETVSYFLTKVKRVDEGPRPGAPGVLRGALIGTQATHCARAVLSPLRPRARPARPPGSARRWRRRRRPSTRSRRAAAAGPPRPGPPRTWPVRDRPARAAGTRRGRSRPGRAGPRARRRTARTAGSPPSRRAGRRPAPAARPADARRRGRRPATGRTSGPPCGGWRPAAAAGR